MGGAGSEDEFGFVSSKSVRDVWEKMPILTRQAGFWVGFVDFGGFVLRGRRGGRGDRNGVAVFEVVHRGIAGIHRW